MTYYYAKDKELNAHLLTEKELKSLNESGESIVYYEALDSNKPERKIELLTEILSSRYIKSNEEFVDLYHSYEDRRNIPMIRNNIRLYLLDVNNIAMANLYAVYNKGLLTVEQRKLVEEKLYDIYEKSIGIILKCDVNDAPVRVSKIVSSNN